MAGPYPPDYGAGPVGPQSYPPSATQGFGPRPGAEPYPDHVASAYPGTLPPPVQYPKRRRWPLIVGVVAVLAVAGLIAALVLTRSEGASTPATALTEESAKAAIQEYLDAMTNGDDETVARHTLCGLFDAVKERRSDLALAGLSADAFRKQYRGAEVTSIDKMVVWSPRQAQVLFTMRATPARGSSRDQSGPRDQQAVAQLLTEDDEVLVCSYLPRTGGQY
ncbi:Rv0361 family membrane protein [Mycolicibacterium sp. XJ1819]